MTSGVFNANAAWTVIAAMAFNLTRAAGTLASRLHARTRTTTIRTQLVNVAARVVNNARTWRLHLPANWPWQHAWENLFTAVHPARSQPDEKPLTARPRTTVEEPGTPASQTRLPHETATQPQSHHHEKVIRRIQAERSTCRHVTHDRENGDVRWVVGVVVVVVVAGVVVRR